MELYWYEDEESPFFPWCDCCPHWFPDTNNSPYLTKTAEIPYDTLDLRSPSIAPKRVRNQLARYGLRKGTTANLPRVSYAAVLSKSDEFLTVSSWQHFKFQAAGVPFRASVGRVSPLEGETPGNSRREMRRLAAKTNCMSKRRIMKCDCKMCWPRGVETAKARKRGFESVAGVVGGMEDGVSDGYCNDEIPVWAGSDGRDVFLGHSDFTFHGDGWRELWGVDWSAAVDIAEQKWKRRTDERRLTEGAYSRLYGSESTLPDEWVIWECEDDFSLVDWSSEYASDEWDMLENV